MDEPERQPQLSFLPKLCSSTQRGLPSASEPTLTSILVDLLVSGLILVNQLSVA